MWWKDFGVLHPAIAWTLRRSHIGYFLLTVGASAALFWGALPWPDTPDGLFHLHRARALAEALQMGVLLPRWFPDFAFGYGYPVLNFYAPAFYYGPALLHLLGFDLITATRLSLALWFGLSGLAMIALLRCWTRPAIAMAGSLLYLVFPYRLYDLFVRGALPEFAAFFWLPLIVFLNYRLIQASWSLTQRHKDTKGVVFSNSQLIQTWAGIGWIAGIRTPWFFLLALAWVGLFLTHNLTALMAVFAAGLMILLLTPISAARSPVPYSSSSLLHTLVLLIGQIALPLAAGIALSAFQLAPVLLEAGWVMLGAAPGGDGFRRHFAGWETLTTAAATYPYPDVAAPTVALPGYVIVILGLAFVALVTWRTMPLRTHLFVAWVMSMAFVLLTTAASTPLWSLFAPVFGKLQFPWRWQTLLSVAFVCTAATLFEALWIQLQRRLRQDSAAFGSGWVPLASGLAAIYATLYAVAGLAPVPAPFTAQELTIEQMWAFDAEHGQVGATWTAEFLPRWVSEERWAIGRAPTRLDTDPAHSPVSFSTTPTEQGYLESAWIVRAAEPFTLRFHRFYYPAWRVTVDGHDAPAYPDGPLGVLAVDLGAGDNRVDVRFAATPALQLGLLVSGLALFALVLLPRWKRDGEWKANLADQRGLHQQQSARSASSTFHLRFIAGVLAVAALLAVNLNLTAATIQPQEIGADYGAVRLEAATLGDGKPGDALPVRLVWTINAATQPLTTFVHLVGADGQMAAQRDEPLAGAFTPHERWQPGMVLEPTHHVSLPADLAPGVYTVFAGIYPAGQPDAPLQPLNRLDARIELGSVVIVR